jgi:DNA invertase Pin-like site-specific DNA recombinase
MTLAINGAPAPGIQVGYAHVSTQDQNPAQQVEALRRAGCDRIFEEIASGRSSSRPQLKRMLARLAPGDTLVVWKLDRLGRSLRDLLMLLKDLKDRGIHFRSLSEYIDTATPAGTMLMQMVGAFAEFERSMIVERTQAGLKRARAEGRRLGRKPKLDPGQQRQIYQRIAAGELTQADAARMLGVSKPTISRLVARTDSFSLSTE